MKRLSKLFRDNWKPREGIVYKSWFRGDSHLGKTATVKILYDNEEYEGTFKVNSGMCEIRIGHGKWKYGLEHGAMTLFDVRRLITSTENISFKKTIRNIDTISRLGQNGYSGKEIIYYVKVLNPKIVEEKTL